MIVALIHFYSCLLNRCFQYKSSSCFTSSCLVFFYKIKNKSHQLMLIAVPWCPDAVNRSRCTRCWPRTDARGGTSRWFLQKETKLAELRYNDALWHSCTEYISLKRIRMNRWVTMSNIRSFCHAVIRSNSTENFSTMGEHNTLFNRPCSALHNEHLGYIQSCSNKTQLRVKFELRWCLMSCCLTLYKGAQHGCQQDGVKNESRLIQEII